MARLALLFVVAAVSGAAIAGCGSSSSSSSSSTPASSSSSSAAAPAAAATSSAAAGGGSSVPSNPEIAQAVAACKTEVEAAPTLSASVKSQLVSICEKAASGNETGVKQAAYQVCQEIVKATVPGGSVQSTALAACPKP